MKQREAILCRAVQVSSAPRRFATWLVLIWGALLHEGAAQEWPQFRGPDGQGHSAVQNLPLRWSEDSSNIRWKTPIDGLGWSSPVVQSGRVWLTTATEEGRSLRAVSLDLATGREIHNVEVFRIDDPLAIHDKNSHASPSPIIHGQQVYVHFGTNGTACLSPAGKVLWRRILTYNHVHGSGGSPVIFDNLLIVNCDGRDVQYVVALNCQTGDVRWKTERPENPDSKKFAFSTPLLIDVCGQPQLVSAGAGNVVSYDPRSGRQLWQVEYPGGYSVVPRPVYARGLVFLATGFNQPSLLAIRPDGRENVTDTHVAWSFDRAAPHSPSPLIVGDEIYLVSDRGIATCLDARSGKTHWQERLGGNYSASPLYAASRIYFLDEDGTTTVIRPGTTYRELARNTVTGQTLASLTPIEGALLLRTDSHLMCIDAGSTSAGGQ